MSETTKAFKVVLPVKPIVLKQSIVAFNEYDVRKCKHTMDEQHDSKKGCRKLPPHIREHPDTLEYRKQIKEALAEEFAGMFKCPIKIHFEFYMPTARPTYVTGVAYEIVRALVPAFVEHHKYILQTSERIFYPPKNAKSWQPRTEIFITPLEFEF